MIWHGQYATVAGLNVAGILYLYAHVITLI